LRRRTRALSRPCPLSFSLARPGIASCDDGDDFELVYKAVAGGDSVEQVRRVIEVCARGSAQRRAAAVNREGSYQAAEMRTARDETPLAAACRLGRGDLVALLVEAGAGVHVRGNVTPLAACIPYGDVDIVRALLRAGVDANARLTYKPHQSDWSPDTSACSAAHLCLWPPQVPLARDRAGPPQLEILEILAREGNLDVNARDADGRTPLFGVPRMASGQEAAVDLLVALGADVNARGGSGSGSGPSDTPLIAMLQKAPSKFQMPCVRKLVAAGAQTSGVVGARGLTPLATAATATATSTRFAFLLAEAGAPADECNPVSGETALHACANQPATLLAQVCAMLLDAGADADAVDIRGRTPIFWVRRAVRLVVAAGAAPFDLPRRLSRRVGSRWLHAPAGHPRDLLHEPRRPGRCDGDPAPLVCADAARRRRPRPERGGLHLGNTSGVRLFAPLHPSADRRAALFRRAVQARHAASVLPIVVSHALPLAARNEAELAARRSEARRRNAREDLVGLAQDVCERRREDGGGKAAARRGARGPVWGQLGDGEQRRRRRRGRGRGRGGRR